jgi:transcriptional regulator with XRE-family HTH domain
METLREVRVRQLLSIRGLAELAKVSPQTVASVEAGQVLPQPGTIRKLAVALGVEPGEIVEFRRAMDAAIKGKEAA